MEETYQDGAGVGLVVDKEGGYLGYMCVLTIGKRNFSYLPPPRLFCQYVADTFVIQKEENK